MNKDISNENECEKEIKCIFKPDSELKIIKRKSPFCNYIENNICCNECNKILFYEVYTWL